MMSASPTSRGFRWKPTTRLRADDQIPRPLDICDVPMGIQICSDINRPAGTHILAAQGAEIILGHSFHGAGDL